MEKASCNDFTDDLLGCAVIRRAALQAKKP